MIHDDRRLAPLKSGKTAEQLGLHFARRDDRAIEQRREGIHFVLGCLNGDLIIHAVLEIEPEVWGGLSAGTQRSEHRASHVSLTKTELLGTRAVNVDTQVRPMDQLVKMHDRRTGDFFHAGLDLLGKGVVLRVTSCHLNVDRDGQTEVQDLADDVCSLKEELHVRELLAQPVTQRAVGL